MLSVFENFLTKWRLHFYFMFSQIEIQILRFANALRSSSWYNFLCFEKLFNCMETKIVTRKKRILSYSEPIKANRRTLPSDMWPWFSCTTHTLENGRVSDKDESEIIIKFKLFGGLNGVDDNFQPFIHIYLSSFGVSRVNCAYKMSCTVCILCLWRLCARVVWDRHK